MTFALYIIVNALILWVTFFNGLALHHLWWAS